MKKRKKRHFDEPLPEGDEWVEFGGELIFAVGFTSGGAPYGINLKEFRRSNEEWERKAGWAQAKRVLRGVLGLTGLDDSNEADIDYLRFLASGLSYKVYSTACWHPELWGGSEKRVVVRLPQQDAPSGQAESALREIKLLAHLSSLDLPVRVPEVLGGMAVGRGVAVVQELLDGDPLDFRTGRAPWQTVAEVASICHGIDPQPLEKILRFHPTRRAHALSALGILDGLDSPAAAEARDWAAGHLPSSDPARLIHGDLLGQNLLLGLEGESIGILDWGEARIGDPAYDLAIVTRGVRKPFGTSNGLNKLLQGYNARSEIQLRASDVQLYELCLLAGYCEAADREYGRGSSHAKNQENMLASFIRRVK
ncbi:MAG: aminoglycoside phosphotransferase family protein [Acidobacteriota bacterium]